MKLWHVGAFCLMALLVFGLFMSIWVLSPFEHWIWSALTTAIVVAVALFLLEDRSAPASASPGNAEGFGGAEGETEGDELERPTPLCTGCLAPVDSRQHYCDECGEAVGRYTGYLPYVNIRFRYNFLGRLWNRIWWDPDVPASRRVGYFLLLCLIGPGMLIGLPIVLFRKSREPRAPTPASTPPPP